MVIGLDCAPPALVFDRFREAMPHLGALSERGVWGPLRSTIPPITVPAWTTMVTGRDPGELGLYGFRDRVAGSYALRTVSADDVGIPRVWDRLGETGRRVVVCFVPPTWPVRPVRGELVSCFLARDAEHTWPRTLGRELEARFGPYRADVDDPRRGDVERVLGEIREMTAQHFAIARHLWETRRPDFLMMVEMGPDRLHHACWRTMQPGGAHERAARAYYADLDRHAGELIARAGPETTVIVASDHGARSSLGAVRINAWLVANGWQARTASGEIDWSHTRAWGEGGYYARIFLNVAGREPEGVVAKDAFEGERSRLCEALRAMTGPDGAPLGNVVLRPQDAFRATRGAPPDLLAFFGDLAWRSVAGLGEIFATDDPGDDGCNHDWNGIFVMAGPGIPARGPVAGMQIADVAATILARFGLPPLDGAPSRDLGAPS